MRLPTLVCVAWLAAAVPSFAQGHHLGVKGGVNVATQNTSGDSGGPALDSRIGGVVGAFWTLPLASWLDVQAEGLYSMKGARLKFQGIESTFQLDYFEVPVLGRVLFGSGHRRYYAAGGPSIAFRVRAKTRTALSGATEEIDVADQVERIDMGIAAGGGMEMGRLVIDGRYTYGLSDLDKDSSSTTKNRAIAVTAGFRF